MKYLFCAACVLMTNCCIAAAAIPESGACKGDTGMIFPLSITWSGEDTHISIGTDKYTSKIVGMRPHGEEFKFSAFYMDSIVGLTEVIIFAYIDQGAEHYRIGSVTYDETQKGERVVSSMSGFSDATCVVLP